MSFAGLAFGQEETETVSNGITRTSSRADLTGGIGAGVYSASLGFTRTHGLLKSSHANYF